MAGPERIELSINPYHGFVIPLNYKSKRLEQDIGFEPMTFSLATRHSTTELILHCLAEALGIEPRITESKSGVIPFH